MNQIILGSIILSLLHAFIPSHWLPVVAIGRKEKWSDNEVTFVTFMSGMAHATSTILIGLAVGYAGITLSDHIQYFTQLIAPVLMVTLGIFYIYRHYHHHHFHINEQLPLKISKQKIIISLVMAMFLSPCLEIEAYFMMAGTIGWWEVLLIAVIYLSISVTGMVLWVRVAYKGVISFEWHTLDHNAGIITGWTLILTGVISYFIS